MSTGYVLVYVSPVIYGQMYTPSITNVSPVIYGPMYTPNFIHEVYFLMIRYCSSKYIAIIVSSILYLPCWLVSLGVVSFLLYIHLQSVNLFPIFCVITVLVVNNLVLSLILLLTNSNQVCFLQIYHD